MPFPHFGPGELAIIMVIVLIVFGAGKFAAIGGALGKSIRDFRKEVSGSKGEPEVDEAPPVSVTTSPVAQLVCRSCSAVIADGARFCAACGTSVSSVTTPVTPAKPTL